MYKLPGASPGKLLLTGGIFSGPFLWQSHFLGKYIACVYGRGGNDSYTWDNSINSLISWKCGAPTGFIGFQGNGVIKFSASFQNVLWLGSKLVTSRNLRLCTFMGKKLSWDAQWPRWGEESNWIFFFIMLDFPCLMQIWKVGMVSDVPHGDRVGNENHLRDH